ncbi:tetratricopeptide repeat-containing sensor histidine kinase [Olleya aquimaris]|uniref:Tetratricopeptide repeat protein n=1 Tax=Olleya aquimaris TaxID=639310 RepID=A0A327RLT4_9FLAO|nr:histidine kinase [Olleya aquimaris]RAJ14687.1 tetratricopeptide repeat protein [Olleya aquimaris]
MKHLQLLFTLFICLFVQQSLYAQEQLNDSKSETFTVKGLVRESDNNDPISDVNIQVNGGSYTSTNIGGEFRIDVRIGDEIMISHKDFETIYYKVKSDEDIRVEVEPLVDRSYIYKNKAKENSFESAIDSALFYKKISAEKSIQFITESIPKSTSVKQNAEAFEVLADVYMHWKQYDLAVTNYRISLNNVKSNDVNLKLAKAYYNNKNYQESLAIYNSLKSESLSNWQNVLRQEGLGDVYVKTNQNKKATTAYKEGLKVATVNNIQSKITDLNSKLGEVYNEEGEKEMAEDLLENSVVLAAKENKTREVEQKVKFADFQNVNRSYDAEIQTRKEIIKDIDAIEKDSIIDNESAITKQKQNYKIGNAYYLQKDYEEAIPYLEKSIAEADKREDLIVKKDATKKISDVYLEAGNIDKARLAFEEYTKTVDELYNKKEQEIAQAARFNKRIAEKQNRINSLETDRKLTLSQVELSDEKNKRQQLIIYSLIGGLLLLALTAHLMYKYIKQQKLANNLLALKSLRSQMNPHFIFNALNSVNSFIATNDERTANKYLSDFSKLMRAVLENSEEDFIPLEKEIELIELYTKLEHFRFKDKFDYTIEVDNTIDVDAYKIPPMLLQPYIENAVWHGLRYKEEKGLLAISISKKRIGEIEITIADNGIGRKKSKSLKTENQQKHNSKGLGNIKKRVSILNEMYKDKVDVFIDDNGNQGDVGTKVVVTLKKD